ncbi:hypothetical protein [Mesorhizobium neociceri]|uniref:Uncharacterized protein n=1 Tax=Mesorhizobium neociceri TaxID=1307853 RepID=A0A838B311_9HYPH|nr:hypothetical protein [Mesorhizobium neociceri]MBA1141248.1 hypothetical protein [Mesorhizobium neociceri]
MTKIIPENKARQGRWGWHGLRILIAALLLAFIAWGIAEIYGEKIRNNAPANQSAPVSQGQPAGG